MATVFFGFILLIIALFIVKVLLPQLLSGTKDYPYTKDLLFSVAERSFLGVLDKVVGDKYRVLGKVRLADIIKVKSGLSPQERRVAFNQIQSKHVDFVLCDPKDLSVQLVVELDDSSHDAKNRKDRDIFVDKALETAGIKVVRVKARKSYKLEEVRKALSCDFIDLKVEDKTKISPKVKAPPPLPATLPPPLLESDPTPPPIVVKPHKLDKYWGASDLKSACSKGLSKDAPYQITEGGKGTRGYYSLVEVQSAYQRGELAKDALYWKDGMKEWLPVSSL